MLGSLNSTIVWWDDAEGEMQSYYEARSFVGYYKERKDLLPNLDYRWCHDPKNGNKSIAIGGTSTAMLHLRINLIKNAKLSYWYADHNKTTTGTIFSINNVEKRKWTTDVNWSFIEFDLEPGINNLIWEKNGIDELWSPKYHCFYFSLDDILINYE